MLRAIRDFTHVKHYVRPTRVNANHLCFHFIQIVVLFGRSTSIKGQFT